MLFYKAVTFTTECPIKYTMAHNKIQVYEYEEEYMLTVTHYVVHIVPVK